MLLCYRAMVNRRTVLTVLESLRGRRLAAVVVLATLLFWLSTPLAGAHTGFESSSPSDGAVVGEAVSEISLTFSGEATPTGDGFVVLDPNGAVRSPSEVASDDNLTWVLRFDEPLAGGSVGVRWTVAAPDAHPISGSFSFTITAEAEPQPAELNAGGQGEDASPAAAIPVETLDSFLDAEPGPSAAITGVDAVASIINVLGAVIAIGGGVFAALALRGDRSDVRSVLFWIRRGGALLMVGAVLDGLTHVAEYAGGWSGMWSPTSLRDALWTSAGLAIALGLLGGALITTRTSLATTTAQAPHSRSRNHEATAHRRLPHTTDHTWDVGAAIGALVGIALVAASFMFDGHTVSEGPRWLHAVVNLVHVVAAATWAGGVAMLAYVIWRRRHRAVDTHIYRLAARFSVIATGALVMAGLAGVALSVVILDSLSELWSTDWGRLLALKVGLVVIAATGGGYNHRVVVPALDRAPTDRAIIDRFRLVVSLEALALLAVAVVTALLIGASST